MNSQESRVESGEPDSAPSAGRWGDEELPAAPERDKNGHFWMLFALMVLAAGTLVVLQARRPEVPSEFAGRPLPPLEVAGWINVDGTLSADDLQGRVVLANFWATNCPSCVRQLPELVSFAKRFSGKGVVVVGLTPESNEFGYLQRFVDRVPGLEWPIGYGAGMAFELLSIDFTPTYILYDRSGKSVWGGHTLDGLEDAAIATLAKKVKS